jgi:hypothetical protein
MRPSTPLTPDIGLMSTPFRDSRRTEYRERQEARDAANGLQRDVRDGTLYGRGHPPEEARPSVGCWAHARSRRRSTCALYRDPIRPQRLAPTPPTATGSSMPLRGSYCPTMLAGLLAPFSVVPSTTL